MSNSDDVANYHDTLCIPRVKRAPTNSGLEALSGFFSLFNVDIVTRVGNHYAYMTK